MQGGTCAGGMFKLVGNCHCVARIVVFMAFVGEEAGQHPCCTSPPRFIAHRSSTDRAAWTETYSRTDLQSITFPILTGLGHDLVENL